MALTQVKGSSLDQGIVRTFDSVADMVAATGLSIGDKVQTLGYYSAGDGGGNIYEIVAAGTGTADGGSFIDLTGISGQAKGLFVYGASSPKQFGAKGDGVTDDTAALQAAIDFGLPVDDIGSETYLTTSVVLKDGAVLSLPNATLLAGQISDGLITNQVPSNNIYLKVGKIDVQYTTQTSSTTKAIVLTDVNNSMIDVSVTNCGSHGAVFSDCDDCVFRVHAKSVGKSAAGYGCYLFNSNRNKVYSYSDDFTIGLAIEASGSGKTSNENIVYEHYAINGRSEFSQSGAGLHLEQSSGGVVSGTHIYGPVCLNSTGEGLVLSSVSNTYIKDPVVKNNTGGGVIILSSTDFLIDGGIAEGNATLAASGYKAQVRIDDSGLSPSSGTIRAMKGSGTDEGVKMFVAGSVDFIDCDLRGTINDFNVLGTGQVTLPTEAKPFCDVYLTVDKTTTGTIIFDAVSVDNRSNYSTSTGNFTAPVSGYYAVHAAARSANTADGTIGLSIYAAGVVVASGADSSGSATLGNVSLSAIVKLDRGDVVTVSLDGGSASGGSRATKMVVHML